MYDHSLHHWRKHSCCYCLQAFSTEEILKCYIKDYFKINGKQRIAMSEKGEYVKFKNYERMIIIYTGYNLCRFWKYFSATK